MPYHFTLHLTEPTHLESGHNIFIKISINFWLNFTEFYTTWLTTNTSKPVHLQSDLRNYIKPRIKLGDWLNWYYCYHIICIYGLAHNITQNLLKPTPLPKYILWFIGCNTEMKTFVKTVCKHQTNFYVLIMRLLLS